MLAAIRGPGQDFPVLLHIVGAAVVFGALLASATSLALARGEIRLLRLGYFSLLLVGLTGPDPATAQRAMDLLEAGFGRPSRQTPAH
jgi:hypothetical protein